MKHNFDLMFERFEIDENGLVVSPEHFQLLTEVAQTCLAHIRDVGERPAEEQTLDDMGLVALERAFLFSYGYMKDQMSRSVNQTKLNKLN